jgi:hypothetical protein
MYHPRICPGRWAVFALSVLALASAWPAAAQIPIVVKGTDYFETVGVATDDIPGIGTVGFVGNPLDPGKLGTTDTIVQRLNDVDLSSGSGMTDIQITALSLKSAAPVNVGGSFFDVFVTLDPNPTGSHDMGTITIHGDANGGTWDSTLDVFFDAKLVEVGNPGNTQTLTGLDLMLNSTGALWGPTPPPGVLLISGLVGDLAANNHTDLINNADIHQVDFWPGLVHQGPHPVDPGRPVPEPSTLSLCVSGLLVFGLWKRTARRR